MIPQARAVPSLTPHVHPERPWHLARPSLSDELAARAEDPALRDVVAGIRRAARRPGPVWIQGESGVGKEYFARRIHELRWGRSDRFECFLGAELRATRLEAALLAAEHASNAAATPLTLYVRNPDRFPESTGRLLASWFDAPPFRGFRRRTLLIAASIPPSGDASRQRPRERPFVLGAGASVLTVPPLRERELDLRFVVLDLIRELSMELRVAAPTLSTASWRHLSRRPWHGNVRELLNCLRQAMLLSPPGEPLVIPEEPEECEPERSRS